MVKFSKKARVSLVVVLVALTFSMVVPVSAGLPGKLRHAYEEGALQLHYNPFVSWLGIENRFGYEPVGDLHLEFLGDLGLCAVWTVSAEDTFVIIHGYYYITPTQHSTIDPYYFLDERYPNYGWWMGHPYKLEIVVDGQEVSTKRFCDLIKYEGDEGIEWTEHYFTFYHIFHPGELTSGYHVFNIHYETTMSEYDPVTGEWIKLKDPWIGSALDFWHWNKDWWGVPLIDNLVIYVS